MSERSLIETLEAAFNSATSEKRLAALDHVTDLFVAGVNQYTDEQIALFDEVFLKLSADIEIKARRKLARSLAPLGRAPGKTIQRLARDPHAAVAAPVLSQALELKDSDIVEVANSGSQSHLHAIARRPSLNETVSDALVERGNHRVARRVASHDGARISEATFDKLVARAGSDDVLAHAVGARKDIPRQQFIKLLRSASSAVRVKFASAGQHDAYDVDGAITEIVGNIGQHTGIVSQDPGLAESEIDRLLHPNRSGDIDTHSAAHARKVEQTAKALSLMCHVPFKIAERALMETKPDMLLIFAKAANWSWKTAKSLLLIQSDGRAIPTDDLQRARANFEQLQVDTARQVIEHYSQRLDGMKKTSPRSGKNRAPAA